MSYSVLTTKSQFPSITIQLITLFSIPSENHYLVSGHMYLFLFDLVCSLGWLVGWLVFYHSHESNHMGVLFLSFTYFT